MSKRIYRHGNEILSGYAKKNRKNPTVAEYGMIYIFKKLGIKVKRQYPISINYNGAWYNYILDFRGKKEYTNVVIEVDGGYHLQPNIIEYDRKRTEVLEYAGFKVYRITNDEVCNGKAEQKLKCIFNVA